MTKDNKLITFEDKYTPIINDFLKNNLHDYIDQNTLNHSMEYSVMAGGKRLRPMLSIATLITLNHSINNSMMKAISALELLHTYSLIHDDLPAMDNDSLRRGKPTNHVKFGSGMATLAGDGLLTLAFQWLVDNKLDPNTKVRLVYNLSKAAGPTGMVSGQSSDVEFENTKLNFAELRQLHRHKTGALINYAVHAGLIIGRASSDVSSLLLKFADNFGLAFQIYDDILDVVGNEKQLGKPVHQDEKKNTYPNLFGLDKSYQKLEVVINNGKSNLKQLQNDYHINTSLLNSFFSYFQIHREE